ncbi:alpha-amylase family glycosyl hydrolase [Flaviaesturariibacter amylovorans]|uniref:Glycoside hydrolase family 13 protein n=1 Tax=Flaviaesturariibacter amylovorans TaxID=1084520 RepID=A0ABP8H0A9_9BACT
MNRPILLLLLLCLRTGLLSAQAPDLYPAHWWSGMTMNRVQLLVHDKGRDLSGLQPSVAHPGVRVLKIHRFSNPRYLALDLAIAPGARPGHVPITLRGAGKTPVQLQWMLKERRPGRGTRFAQGITPSDFVYLAIADRFANGDPSNDRVPGLREQTLNRDSMYHRHGGDLQGISKNLGYLESLGVTALWLLPVLENDRPARTEHGYAITNHFRVDPRLGGDAAYRELSDALHARGMKLVMDAVYNHTGLQHHLELDPPDSTWMHRWPRYTQTTYREQTLFDPYAAPSDTKRMSDGWFDDGMPDINHHNPHMAAYLIQSMIWQIEEFGVDAVRIDTYTYSDLDFSNRCNAAILAEYPRIHLFGETRVFGSANQAYFNRNVFTTKYKSNLPGSVDFQLLYFGIRPALTQATGWMEGVNSLYNTLANDFLNQDATRNVLLLDNHDEPRFLSVVGEDWEKLKIGYTWLLTCRGIPQAYYGSEIGMRGVAHPDGLVRADMPGGWPGDAVNAFTGAGLGQKEKEVLDHVRKLGTYRKTSSALQTGRLMQYVPVGNVYAYFRYDQRQTVMCILNAGATAAAVPFSRFPERTAGFTQARDVLSGSTYATSGTLTVPPMGMLVLELK